MFHNQKSRDILEENLEKEISSLTITDCEQDQEKTQCRHPTEISDIPRAPTCKLAKLIREILEENLEKSSLIVSKTKKKLRANVLHAWHPPKF